MPPWNSFGLSFPARAFSASSLTFEKSKSWIREKIVFNKINESIALIGPQNGMTIERKNCPGLHLQGYWWYGLLISISYNWSHQALKIEITYDEKLEMRVVNFWETPSDVSKSTFSVATAIDKSTVSHKIVSPLLTSQ